MSDKYLVGVPKPDKDLNQRSTKGEKDYLRGIQGFPV